ncbi:MAG: PIN domain-containing protein [Sulfolobaceae archaeon]|nr:PIN domain-containing protein [Sulfolobaceae archaeon]
MGIKINVNLILATLKRVLSLMNIINVELDEEVLEEAVKRGLTYYDSVYLVIAKRINAKLVSLDKDLIKNGAIELKKAF